MSARRIPDMTSLETARFWSKTNRSTECWEWTASRKPSGYGRFSIQGNDYPAHRVAYHLTHGSVPLELDLDHLCRNRACVNPMHLEPVTRRVNLRRGNGTGRTSCPQGHPYVTGNIYMERTGTKKCRTCVIARVRAYKIRRRLIQASAA